MQNRLSKRDPTERDGSGEGELRGFEQRSAEKLHTTPGNKRRHYLKRQVAKRHYLLADALFANFCEVMRDFPTLADRLGMDVEERPAENDLLKQIDALGPEEKAKLVKDLMDSLFGNGRSAG